MIEWCHDSLLHEYRWNTDRNTDEIEIEIKWKWNGDVTLNRWSEVMEVEE